MELIYGVGYNSKTFFKKYETDGSSKAYDCWRGMLRRCYSEKERYKYPTYVEVSICDEWKDFQNFAKWFYANYKKEVMKDWVLDKDLIVKGSKIYSPETCCFIPQEINKIIIKSNRSRGEYPIGVFKLNNRFIAQLSKNSNRSKHISCEATPEEAFKVYKTAKEEYIKEVANEWRGQITERVYQAMYNYKVEITD